MKISIPDLSLVVLIGPSGSGKSTFARKHFKATEILSSDACRGMVSDDELDQTSTPDAFAVLHFIAGKRLDARRLTVVDATNVQPESRKPLVQLARDHHALPVAIVFDGEIRNHRGLAPHVIRSQCRDLRRSIRGLQREGFRHVTIVTNPDDVEIERVPLWVDRRSERGPFDVIGDVHGCGDELRRLLEILGGGRKVVFVGDLVDRGPDVVGVLKIVMSMVKAGTALCVAGNHEVKLLKKLRGKDVQITHGLAESLAQIEKEPPEFRKELEEFLDGLISHYVLDEGRLVVAHAGLPASMQGRASQKVREFSLYGETTGETDEFGLPIRYNWAADYRGRALVVYGHTPVPEPEFLNGTVNIDTGCVFGGRLTALRYPERELVSVPAAKVFYASIKPFPSQAPAAEPADDMLEIEDVTGKRHITTRLQRTVIIREENAAAALEVMSRWAADPRWLIYLPPTMSPCETSARPGLLEHPAEAFAYFRGAGVPRVVCEEKHMGSRAVVIVCRDAAVGRKRFGVAGAGIVYTRTGRRFFDDASLESGLLDRVRAAMDAARLWDELSTDWVCLDAELMPWSAKAQELVTRQYAAVGAAARAALAEVASLRPPLPDIDERLALVDRYTAAYARYCWPVRSLDDLKLAPFHLLATEGRVHADRDHAWHMETLARLAGGVIVSTPWRVVDVLDAASQDAAVAWWEDLTSRGGEGMVVKPLPFLARGPKGLVQPAVKVRGPEYLRIIYGPEYTRPAYLDRLRARGLSAKRSLALREFALGLESLDRFIRREPLRRVHECVFGVLALESEPVDPRL